MKKQILISVFLIMLILLTSCGTQVPPHRPMHPNYNIIKPKVKYKVSKSNLSRMVKKLQGSPYVWAEEGPRHFDCSGFMYYMYGSMGIEIPRVARHQAKSGIPIDAKDLKYGDLIFFATEKARPRRISHVGMYLGKGWFTHASTTKHKVMYSNLYTSDYYRTHLRGCRRYLPQKQEYIPTKQASVWKPKVVALPTVPKAPVLVATVPAVLKAATIAKPMTGRTSVPTLTNERAITEGQYYYVQVGSFIGTPKETLLAKIKNRGFKYRQVRYLKESQQASKVLIGPYPSKSQSITALNTVRTHINPDAFIVLRIE